MEKAALAESSSLESAGLAEEVHGELVMFITGVARVAIAVAASGASRRKRVSLACAALPGSDDSDDPSLTSPWVMLCLGAWRELPQTAPCLLRDVANGYSSVADHAGN